MQTTTIDSKKPVELSDAVFGSDFNEPLIHQAVVAFRAGGRSGTRAQKTRSEVVGTTKKFKKQKGGGARHGDYRAPIFVGGGVTFAAKPKSYAQKINKKMFRTALSSILSELCRQNRLKVIETIALETPKTKNLLKQLQIVGESKTLIIVDGENANLYLAARNLPKVDVLTVEQMNPVSLIAAEQVLVTVGSIKKVEEWLS